ncbi:MAG: hypothetical protein ACFB4I_01395 [Cyanophyceae cyanobacterium]
MNQSHQPSLAADLALSLATGPFLLGLVALGSVADLLQELGQTSEEMFRGDRLPILPVPEAPPKH